MNLDPTVPVGRWAEPGVELQWESPREPVCRVQADCAPNATCELDPKADGILRSFCSSGFERDPIEGICAETEVGGQLVQLL